MLFADGVQNVEWRSLGLEGCRKSSFKIFTVNRLSCSLVSLIPLCHGALLLSRNYQEHISEL